MSKVLDLHVLMSKDFDSSSGVGPWVPLPDVIALGIGPYSRRFQDLRKLYLPQGFDIENRIERCSDEITRSWYRKVRVGLPQADRPENPFERPVPKPRTRRKPQILFTAKVAMKYWEQVCAERDRKIADSQEPPVLVLTP